MTEVALDASYDSAEAFSRAFRRGCGLSPSRYRTAWPPPAFGSPTARVRYCPGEERSEIYLPTGEVSIEVRIGMFNAIKVARVRHVGPYNEVGPCFEHLFEWAATVGARPGRVLSLSYDDPMAGRSSYRDDREPPAARIRGRRFRETPHQRRSLNYPMPVAVVRSRL